eukprot:GFKZ01003541.1.p1 GENE.GFKZ01003541.1~~GFKZ01003541.1.p1  ORF type:complete len:280 (-),score=28.19 GFKZ01003541.1:1810-2649(-)
MTPPHLFSPPFRPPTSSAPHPPSLRRRPPRCVYPRGNTPSSTRIFLDAALTPGAIHPLPPTELAHLRARRLRPGATVTLINPHGRLATAVIQPDESVVVLSAVHAAPPAFIVWAIVGLPKSPQRADCIVEKLTELGVQRVLFCRSDRVVPRAPGVARIQRWERLAVAAAKQSLRVDVPSVEYVDCFAAVLDLVTKAQGALVLSPDGVPLLSQEFLQSLRRPMHVVVLAGPEGGFTEDEECKLVDAGARRVALGANRLRVETAVITATAVISQLAYGTLL